MGITAASPVGRAHLNHHYASDEESISSDNTTSVKSFRKRRGSRGNRGNRSGSDSDDTLTSRGRHKKKDGFSSKIQILEFGGKKGHPHDVAEPLGSGPIALHIIVNTMRIPTSYP